MTELNEHPDTRFWHPFANMPPGATSPPTGDTGSSRARM